MEAVQPVASIAKAAVRFLGSVEVEETALARPMRGLRETRAFDKANMARRGAKETCRSAAAACESARREWSSMGADEPARCQAGELARKGVEMLRGGDGGPLGFTVAS